jgi:hypothetical protein
MSIANLATIPMLLIADLQMLTLETLIIANLLSLHPVSDDKYAMHPIIVNRNIIARAIHLFTQFMTS